MSEEKKKITYFKFKLGDNNLRIIPSIHDDSPAMLKTRVHEFFDVTKKQSTRHVCRYFEAEKDTCICCLNYFNAKNALEAAGGNVDKLHEIEKNYLKFNSRFLNSVNVIDRNDVAKGPQLAKLPWSIVEPLNAMIDRGLEPWDQEKGFDLTIVKSGSGQFGTKYTLVQGFLEKTPLSADQEQAQSWMLSAPKLVDRYRLQSNEDMARNMYYTFGDLLVDMEDVAAKGDGRFSGKKKGLVNRSNTRAPTNITENISDDVGVDDESDEDVPF